jgi:hypothetical protein
MDYPIQSSVQVVRLFYMPNAIASCTIPGRINSTCINVKMPSAHLIANHRANHWGPRISTGEPTPVQLESGCRATFNNPRGINHRSVAGHVYFLGMI